MEFFQTHVLRIAALLDTTSDQVKMWRAVYEQDGERRVAKLARIAAGNSIVRVTGQFKHYLMNGDQDAYEIAAFLGLAAVDPELVVWEPVRQTKSEIAIVREPLAPLRVQGRHD